MTQNLPVVSGLKDNWKLTVSLLSAAAIFTTMVVTALIVGPSSQDRAINFAIIGVGVSLGWMLGILASPYDPKERKHFSELAKALSLFVSGYAIAKADRLVDAIVSREVLLQPLGGFRALALVGAILTTMIITFVCRKYA